MVQAYNKVFIRANLRSTSMWFDPLTLPHACSTTICRFTRRYASNDICIARLKESRPEFYRRRDARH
jgi:hypothetical protein